MKPNQLLLATLVGIQFVFPALAADSADTNRDSDIEVLKQQIHELDQKVRLLEHQREVDRQTAADTAKEQTRELDQKVRILARQRELDKDDATAVAKKQPLVKLDASGFTLASADTNFSISLHGLVQLDSRTFFQNAAQGVDGFILRRARPIISGTVFHDFDFLFVPDFGGSSTVIQDAYLNYRYRPELQVQAGKFKSPVGLEYLQSDTYLPFNERSLVTDLVPGRDLGVELHGDLFVGVVSYAAGIFNGVADAANTANSDFDNDKEFAGRLFFQPLKKSSIEALQGFGFGVSGSYGDESGTSALASKYTTDGQQKFFGYNSNVSGNGTHWRISPQGYYYYGSFGLLGEYVESSQKVIAGANTGTIDNSAWQVVGSWFLTGEENSYKGVTPAHPFNPANGQWGAWELSARYAHLGIDSDAFPLFANPNTSAKSADAWSVGLNWWLNKNVRVLTSFSRTTFSGGASGAVTKKPEEALFTRVQLAF